MPGPKPPSVELTEKQRHWLQQVVRREKSVQVGRDEDHGARLQLEGGVPPVLDTQAHPQLFDLLGLQTLKLQHRNERAPDLWLQRRGVV